MKRITENQKTSRHDITAEFAEKVIDAINNGTAPWIKPWTLDPNRLYRGVYHNAISKKIYSPNNVMLLYFFGGGLRKDPRWMTFLQAKKLGYSIRKGEKGGFVRYASTYLKKEDENLPEEERQLHACFRTFTVFNAEQMEGIPSLEELEEYRAKKELEFAPIEIGEKIIENAIARGVTVTYTYGDECYYQPLDNQIVVPAREQFANPADFYPSMIHELAHWTSLPLKRDTGCLYSDKRVFEELVAEIACWAVAIETGLPHNPQNSTAYIEGWVSHLKGKESNIQLATREAMKIKDYLLEGIDLSKYRQPVIQEEISE